MKSASAKTTITATVDGRQTTVEASVERLGAKQVAAGNDENVVLFSNGEVRQDGLSRMSAAARPRHNLAQDSQREASR